MELADESMIECGCRVEYGARIRCHAVTSNFACDVIVTERFLSACGAMRCPNCDPREGLDGWSL